MRTRIFSLGCAAVLLLFEMTALQVPITAQDEPHQQHDPTAVFKTHVRHLNSVNQLGLKEQGGATSATTPSAVFGGSRYGVGQSVTPTSTLPEAEEEIAVDPNNARNLVAAISDFSLNGGFNTTKFTYSTDGGTTWAESFIPLDPLFGLPATADGNLWFANSDPVVALDKMGNVYLSDLYLDAIDNGNGLYVSVGTLGGGVNSFTVANTFPVVTNPDANTPFLEDKP